MSSKRIGSFAELKVASEFSKYGIPVLLPFGDNEPYDLVIELNGFKSVQVKSTKIDKEVLKIEVRRRVGSKRLGSQSYKEFNIDYLAVMCVDTEKLYLIPFSEVSGGYNFNLRLKPPKNNQTKGVNLAEDYEFAKQIKMIL